MTSRNPRALQLRLLSESRTESCAISVDHLVIASWTARDSIATERRLVELEAMGITRPPALPMFYQIAAARATTSSRIEVVGERTTGEAEFVLLRRQGKLWVGLGSDHTDRELEARDAASSKQACEKPISAEFWALEEIQDHWDGLCLRSFVTDASGKRTAYQEGKVSSMLKPRELISRLAEAADLPDCALLFCGTLPTIGQIRPCTRFELELEDPVLCRRLTHAYEVVALPRSLNG